MKPVTYDRRFFLLKMLQLNYSMYREKKEVKYRIALSGYYSNDKRKKNKNGDAPERSGKSCWYFSFYMKEERMFGAILLLGLWKY